MPKNHSLSQSLLQTWESYAQHVHHSRAKASTKNIHQLRVSTQKLEAVLALAGSLEPNHHSKNIILLIKKVRKSLSPLRDIQVESLALKNLRAKDKNDDKFTRFFTKEKRQAKKKALRSLNKISLGEEKVRINKLVKKLVEIEAHKSQKQIQDQLNHEIKSTTYKVKKIMHNVNPRRVKEIHKFRIQAKKLRYQQECLNSLVGNSRFDLQNLTLVQSVAGRIQNDSVLLKTLDRYLAKKGHHHDRAANKIRRRVKVNRTKIINTDFANLNTIKWQN